jgi:hypothetical protein
MPNNVVAPVEAAKRLGLSLQRVHQLIAAGSLPARSLSARTVVIDRDVLEDFAARRRMPFVRGFAQSVAWAAAALADGTANVTWLSSSERSRLRARLTTAASIEGPDDRLALWGRRLSGLASGSVHLRVHPARMESVLGDQRVLTSGTFAGNLIGDGLLGDEGTVWLRAGVGLDELVDDHALLHSARPNLTIRWQDAELPLSSSPEDRSPWRLVVVADLLLERNSRSERAADNLLAAALKERRWQRS